jgi:predicted Mrr-cat superfamily restriction endonuclease
VTAVYDQLPEAVRARLPLKQVWTAALPDEAQ